MYWLLHTFQWYTHKHSMSSLHCRIIGAPDQEERGMQYGPAEQLYQVSSAKSPSKPTWKESYDCVSIKGRAEKICREIHEASSTVNQQVQERSGFDVNKNNEQRSFILRRTDIKVRGLWGYISCNQQPYGFPVNSWLIQHHWWGNWAFLYSEKKKATGGSLHLAIQSNLVKTAEE